MSAWEISWAPNLLAPGWFFVGLYLCSGYVCGSGHIRLGTLGSVARCLSASVSQLQTKSQMSFKLLWRWNDLTDEKVLSWELSIRLCLANVSSSRFQFGESNSSSESIRHHSKFDFQNCLLLKCFRRCVAPLSMNPKHCWSCLPPLLSLFPVSSYETESVAAEHCSQELWVFHSTLPSPQSL